MKMTHNGKIGRLPKAVQEQLNRRLQNCERGGPLAIWLNSLPEVQAILAARFWSARTRPRFDTSRNVCQSESGDCHAEVRLWQQEAQALAADTGGLQVPGAPPLTDQMAGWVSVRYLMAVRKLIEENDGGKPALKVMRGFCRGIVALRRGDHRGTRLQMEQERLGREPEKTDQEGIGHFERSLKKPEQVKAG
jgi:hypothetical protein